MARFLHLGTQSRAAGLTTAALDRRASPKIRNICARGWTAILAVQSAISCQVTITCCHELASKIFKRRISLYRKLLVVTFQQVSYFSAVLFANLPDGDS